MKPTVVSRNQSLSTEEVCDIIRSSASFGVSTIKFRGLEINFGPQAKIETLYPITQAPPQKSDNNLSAEQHAKNDEEALHQNERELRELQISEMLIENPLAAEEMIRNGELEDADDGSDAGDEFDE